MSSRFSPLSTLLPLHGLPALLHAPLSLWCFLEYLLTTPLPLTRFSACYTLCSAPLTCCDAKAMLKVPVNELYLPDSGFIQLQYTIYSTPLVQWLQILIHVIPCFPVPCLQTCSPGSSEGWRCWSCRGPQTSGLFRWKRLQIVIPFRDSNDFDSPCKSEPKAYWWSHSGTANGPQSLAGGTRSLNRLMLHFGKILLLWLVLVFQS